MALSSLEHLKPESTQENQDGTPSSRHDVSLIKDAQIRRSFHSATEQALGTEYVYASSQI